MMNVIGMDVSKRTLDVCWLKAAAPEKVKTKVFENTASGHTALLKWLRQQTRQGPEDLRLILEAAGVYHAALAYRL